MITSLCKKFGAVCYMHSPFLNGHKMVFLREHPIRSVAWNIFTVTICNYAIICSRASPTPTDDYLYPSKKTLWRIRLIFFYFQSSPCEIIMSPFDVHFATGLFHIISYLHSLWDAIMGKVVSPRYLMLNSPYPLVMSTVCYWKWPSRNSG